MQFLYNPEYLIKDGLLIINENNFKAIGRIIEPLFDDAKYRAYLSVDGKKKRKGSTHSEVRTSTVRS
jgi:hypothetical protein